MRGACASEPGSHSIASVGLAVKHLRLHDRMEASTMSSRNGCRPDTPPAVPFSPRKSWDSPPTCFPANPQSTLSFCRSSAAAIQASTFDSSTSSVTAPPERTTSWNRRTSNRWPSRVSARRRSSLNFSSPIL